MALAAAIVFFAFQTAALALFKQFSIDEFQYAHAAWLIAHGHVPYRDFFEVHLPLVYQALAPVFVVLGDDPTGVVALRVAMLAFVALTAVAAANANRARGRRAMLLAPLLLLASAPYVTFATEIRPDPAAFALFLSAIGVLRLPYGSDRACGFGSGCLLVGALWASQKVILYGSIFLPALVLDVLAARRGPATTSTPRLLRDPKAFVLGAAAGLAGIATYLSATRSWAAWWSWCFAWAVEHQRDYPGFSWLRYFGPTFADNLWLFGFAAVGLVTTIRRLTRRGTAAWRDPDVLLVAALASTFASFALQRAPYPYSLVPFVGIAAVLAARGATSLLGASSHRTLQLGSAALLTACLASGAAALARGWERSNGHQLDVLARVGKLTAPSDVAYDNSGGYVTRPHAYFYFYTDKLVRAFADRLVDEVPAALLDSGCVLHLADLRLKGLPSPLRAFLARHYQPYDGDIALWGQRYKVPANGKLETTFLAVRDDRYFLALPEATVAGTLVVDGRPVREPVFALAKGEHTIDYTGSAGDLYVLWLPRDGKPWTPRWNVPSTFSRLL